MGQARSGLPLTKRSRCSIRLWHGFPGRTVIGPGDESLQSKHLPTLDQLLPHLDVSEVDTGTRYSFTLSSGGEIVTDDIAALHAIANEQGQTVLRSGIEFVFTLYRGQTQEYEHCLPSLARRKHIEEQLLDLCRNVAFEDAIGLHPYVQICEKACILGNPLFINKQGLTQHYGLATDMLDLTSNFDIASFFATCTWDDLTQAYIPIERTDAPPGILYRIPPLPLIQFGIGKLTYVGWQPFPRPEEQRACALIMERYENFATLPGVQFVKFRQDAAISQRIWNSFDKGCALFPNDAVSELARRAANLMEFTQSQINRGWGKLDTWLHRSTKNSIRNDVEKRAGITIADIPILSWDGLTLERDEGKLRNQLEDVLSRVRFRLVKNA